MKILKLVLRIVLAIFMIGAGAAHFRDPDFFLAIMPPYLPFHEAIVAVSGAIEIVLGLALLVPKTSRLAAWGLIALYIAVFPANIHLFMNQDIMPDVSPTMHAVRLPLQGVLILWAYWFTRGPKSTAPSADALKPAPPRAG